MSRLSLLERIFKKLSFVISKNKRQALSQKNLQLMQQSGYDLLIQLSQALATVSNQNFTPESIAIFNKIEALRQTLNHSNELVTIIDYGAGSPEDNRSLEETEKGIVSKLTVQEMCKSSSSPKVYAQLLFQIVHDMKLQKGLELGTCLAISTAYQSSAMQLNGKGHFITCEGVPDLASISQNNLKALGIENCKVVLGRFSETLPKLLKEEQAFDFAFIDGHHDEKATVAYFEQIKPYLDTVAVLIFDDIRWSKGMKLAWDKIREDAQVNVSVDMLKHGIVILDKRVGKLSKNQQHYEFFLE